MTERPYEITRSEGLAHVRRRDTGQCVGCVELGLFEILRMEIRAELLAEVLEAAGRSVVGRKA